MTAAAMSFESGPHGIGADQAGVKCADPEANPSALNVPRNSQGTSPDLSRGLAPTEGAQAPAAASTTNDSSEEQPPLGTAVSRRNRGTRPHYRSAPAPVRLSQSSGHLTPAQRIQQP